MPLSASSRLKLATCHKDLQRLVLAVAAVTPIQVLCGHRNEADQNAAFASGHSKDTWPHSRHNALPSQAVDIAPLPIDWGNLEAFKTLSDTVKIKAVQLGIAVVWGGDWKMQDLVHWQIATVARLPVS